MEGPQRTGDPGVQSAVGEDDVAGGVRAGEPAVLQHRPIAAGGDVEHGQALALVLGLVVRALVPEHVGAACAPGPRSARPCDVPGVNPVNLQRSHAGTDTLRRSLRAVRLQRRAIASRWGRPADARVPGGQGFAPRPAPLAGKYGSSCAERCVHHWKSQVASGPAGPCSWVAL